METNKNLRETYAALLDAKLREELTSQFLFNNKYEGTPRAGVINIPVRGDSSVREYDPVSGIDLEAPETSYVKMTEFFDLAVNEIIDDFEGDAVPDDMIADRLESAAYSLAANIDAKAYAVLEKEGKAVTLKADSAFEQLVEASTMLSKAGVPVNGRVVAVTPEFHAELLLDDRFIRQGDLSQKLREEGAVGQAAGFAVHETNNLKGKDVKFVANHPEWSTQAMDWIKGAYVADLSQSAQFVGAKAVKARVRVGHKVTKKDTVVVGKKADL